MAVVDPADVVLGRDVAQDRDLARVLGGGRARDPDVDPGRGLDAVPDQGADLDPVPDGALALGPGAG